MCPLPAYTPDAGLFITISVEEKNEEHPFREEDKQGSTGARAMRRSTVLAADTTRRK